MHMKTEDRWHCTNPVCGCEVVVESSANQDGENRRCSCGATMKKKYTSLVFTYLDFLRLDEATNAVTRKE